MTRADVIRLAQEVRLIIKTDDEQYIDYLERFAGLVIGDFLARTGQYVTNDASREAAIAAAVAAEREACAKVCDFLEFVHVDGFARRALTNQDLAAAIRARGNP